MRRTTPRPRLAFPFSWVASLTPGVGGLAVVLSASAASAQTPGTVASNPFPGGITQASGLVRIADVAAVPDSNGAKARLNSAAQSPDGRFFVLDQRGPVYTLSGGSATPYLNIANLGLGLLNDNGERGASAIAFHPQFTQANSPGYGKLYLSFSTSQFSGVPDSQVAGQRTHDEVVYELTAANPLAGTYTPAGGTAAREVLRIARPGTNHNGGQIAFNPNATPGTADYGALYVATGDSGGSGDPYAVAQNNTSLMGKILRINALGTGGGAGGNKYGIVADNAFAADTPTANTRGEIYAVGFRNPQRFSWDLGGAQKLYAGDVGQGKIEEINVITNGANYGWGEREGSFDYVNPGTVAYPPNPENPLYTQPIAEYDHDEGQAVSGGFVYRGSLIPSLIGKYVFGDLVNGRIFYIDANETFGGQNALTELRLTEDGLTQKTLLQIINETASVSASRTDLRLGQDAAGTLYVLNKRDGIVRALVPEPAVALVWAGVAIIGLRRKSRPA